MTQRPKHYEETWDYVYHRFIVLPLWGVAVTTLVSVIAGFIFLVHSLL